MRNRKIRFLDACHTRPEKMGKKRSLYPGRFAADLLPEDISLSDLSVNTIERFNNSA